jgi:alkylation response protein AidB-like acyl-CoA dehydrogenase
VTIDLSKEHRQIQKAARDFVRGEFGNEVSGELLKTGAYPEKILSRAGRLGFPGIHFPEDLDGEGLGYRERILITEELARGHSTLGGCIVLAGYGAEILLEHGTRDQQRTWLPRLALGRTLSALAVEDEGERTTAIPLNGEWAITGTKTHVVNGGLLAGFYLVLCADPGKEGNGWSLFLVDAHAPGIETHDAGGRLGQSLVPLARVVFRNVRVSPANLVGRQGQGLDLVSEARDLTGVTLAALAVGTAQGAFDRALAHVRQRRQFGRTLIQFQITRHKLTRMATRIETARVMTRRAALACDRGTDRAPACAMARLTATASAVEVCDEALQLFGGYGYIREYGIEAFYRDAKMLELFDGGPLAHTEALSENLFGNPS